MDIADAQADYAENCEGDLDAEAVADAVIWIRDNHNGEGVNWDRTYQSLGN